MMLHSVTTDDVQNPAARVRHRRLLTGMDARRALDDHRRVMRLPFLLVEDVEAASHELRNMLPLFRRTQIVPSVTAGYGVLASRKNWAGIAIEIGPVLEPALDLLAFVRERVAIPAMIVTGSLDAATTNRVARLRASHVSSPLDEDTIRPFVQRAGFVEHGLEDIIGDEIEYEGSAYGLTVRQTEILAAVVARKGNREIAAHLGISANTLKQAIRRMLHRFRRPKLEEVAMRIRARVQARQSGASPPILRAARVVLLAMANDAKAAAKPVRK